MEYELVYGMPKAEVLAQIAEEFTEATQCVNHAYREIDRIKSEKMERWETRLESAKMRLYAVAVGTKDTIKDIITVSAINPAPAKKLAKELYHKIHPTTPIEQLEADIVERGRNW